MAATLVIEEITRLHAVYVSHLQSERVIQSISLNNCPVSIAVMYLQVIDAHYSLLCPSPITMDSIKSTLIAMEWEINQPDTQFLFIYLNFG